MPESASIPSAEYTRVTLDVPTTRLPEVMSAIGVLTTLISSVEVHVGPVPDAASSSFPVESETDIGSAPEPELSTDQEGESPYTPGMVELMPLPGNPKTRIPLITPALLRAFGEKKYGVEHSGRAARLGGMVIEMAPEETKPYLLLGRHDASGKDRGIGIRAEKALELLEQLQSGEINVQHVKAGLISVLADYCQELFKTSESAEDKSQ